MVRPLFASHICVTGSIGSGKSRVCQQLVRILGWPCLDIDDVARTLMAPGGVGLAAIKLYNAAFIRADGSLDRALLRRSIFNSNECKSDIDNLLHPLIQSTLTAELSSCNDRHIVEIPLLFETGWDALFETIIMVTASKEICVERIVKRDGVTAREAELAYDSQMDPTIKATRATEVIHNNGEWAAVVDQLQEVSRSFVTV